MRVIQHHVGMPGKTWLFLDKERVYIEPMRLFFLQRNGKRNIGRAEANTDQVMNLRNSIL